MIRLLTGAVYRGGRSRLPILVYHRVPAAPDPMLPDTLDASVIAKHFDVLSRYFNVVPLEEAVEMSSEGRLPRRAVSITFDDGYRDNFDVGLPLLRHYGLNATIFVATAFLEGGPMFCDIAIECARRWPSGEIDLSAFGLGRRAVGDAASRVAIANDINQAIRARPLAERDAFCERLAATLAEPLPQDIMMSPEQVSEISRHGVTIGGHTENHPNLAILPRDKVAEEIALNRRRIASLTGRTPRAFAYPFGWPKKDFTAETMDVVRDAGYESAVSMAWGVASVPEDRYQMPRIGPQERTERSFLNRMLVMATRTTSGLIDVERTSPAPAASIERSRA